MEFRSSHRKEEEDLEVPETSGEDNSYGYSPKIHDEGDTEVCNPWEVCAKPEEEESEEEEEADLEVESDLEVNSTKPSYKPSYSSSKVFNPWASEPEAEEEEEEADEADEADEEDGDSAESESDKDSEDEEDLEVETETDNKKSSYNPWNRPSYAPPQIEGPPSPFNSFFSWF